MLFLVALKVWSWGIGYRFVSVPLCLCVCARASLHVFVRRAFSCTRLTARVLAGVLHCSVRWVEWWYPLL